MNENIDLTKILKNCPKGFELYSLVHGEVKFVGIDNNPIYFWIDVVTEDGVHINYTSEGKASPKYNGECILFPSKDQRDWSKFKCSKPKFDPKTLKPFDRILQRDSIYDKWHCGLFSFFNDPMLTHNLQFIVPYNEETKHLVGTSDEAPEYYRYWEE